MERAPPAVFGCCCPSSLCLTLSYETKPLSIFQEALTHSGQLKHYFAVLLIQYRAKQRTLFIATLISSSPLVPTLHHMLKIYSTAGKKRGH